jgi:hypothetical protein
MKTHLARDKDCDKSCGTNNQLKDEGSSMSSGKKKGSKV